MTVSSIVGACLRLVLDSRKQISLLADCNEAHSQQARRRAAKDEAARLDATHFCDATCSPRFHECSNHRGERWAIIKRASYICVATIPREPTEERTFSQFFG